MSSTISPESNVSDNSSALETIADRSAKTEQVEYAMREIGPVRESSEFWANIANDKTYPVERRRQCIVQLFRRHVHAGMSLKEVAEKLNKPNYLADQDIILVDLFSGLIPVHTVFGDTIVALILLPPSQGDKIAIYLRISGKVAPQAVGEVLRGELSAGRVAESKVEEIGFSPGA